MTPRPPAKTEITGVILAGGKGRRMGGQDKGLMPLAGRPLIARVIEGLKPQVVGILVNANRNLDAYAAFGYPLIPDNLDDFQGPLAGFASAMAAVSTPWVVTVPCDGPYIPPDLVERLIAALERDAAEIAVATDGERMQPVYALLPVALAESLQAFLAADDRKIDRWYARHRIALADFSDTPDTFANLNSPDDAGRLEREFGR